MAKNIEINISDGSGGYEVLYPKTLWDNVDGGKSYVYNKVNASTYSWGSGFSGASNKLISVFVSGNLELKGKTINYSKNLISTITLQLNDALFPVSSKGFWRKFFVRSSVGVNNEVGVGNCWVLNFRIDYSVNTKILEIDEITGVFFDITSNKMIGVYSENEYYKDVTSPAVVLTIPDPITIKPYFLYKQEIPQ